MTPASRNLPRRTVLAASGTAVLAAAAACSSSTTPTTTTSATSSAAATSAAASAKASTSAAAAPTAADPTTAAADPTTAASEAAPTGTPLASVADVEAAGSMSAKAPSGPVILASSGGTVVCHTAICTHMGCEVAASGACPCHGSKFNVETGAVVQGPASAPLAAVPVTVSGGQVYAS